MLMSYLSTQNRDLHFSTKTFLHLFFYNLSDILAALKAFPFSKGVPLLLHRASLLFV